MIKQINILLTAIIFTILFSACNQNKLVTVTIMGESQVSEITDTSAVLTGTILEVGEDMQAYGHVWGENQNPSITNFKSEYTETAETFSDKLIDLNPETKYYIRPYAKDGDEIIYEDGTEFTTLKEEEIPHLVTSSVTDISYTTATCGGNVLSQGESAVIVRGVCWSTSENPTTADVFTQDGSGIGSYPSYLEDLLDNTTYYVRAYLTNSEETFYGDQVSFTTLDVLPTVTTGDVLSIAYLNAIGNGEVVLEGQTSVTERGICWSASENPTISDNNASNGNGSGTYEVTIDGLEEGTTYYVKAYATNDAGTGYGVKKSFTTLTFTGIVTDIDGNEYNTVQIGDQIWMAANLKVTRYSDGTPIPNDPGNGAGFFTNEEWAALGDNDTHSAYCYSNNNANGEADIYGALYTWGAATNGVSSLTNPSNVQGACPAGWHIPSDAEWTELIDYIANEGYSGFEGKVLRSTTGWGNNHPQENGTDNYGFSALPGGSRLPIGGTFANVPWAGYWWSCLEVGETQAWRRLIDTGNSVDRQWSQKSYGFSVRCIKD